MSDLFFCERAIESSHLKEVLQLVPCKKKMEIKGTLFMTVLKLSLVVRIHFYTLFLCVVSVFGFWKYHT